MALSAAADVQWPVPWWLPGGNAQTIWPALFSRSRSTAEPLRWRRERWATADADFIDVDWVDAPLTAPLSEAAPLMVLFHGLEGSSASHYAQAFGDWALRFGWRLALPHFRGCSGEINLAPRAYHSADFEEIGWVLGRLRAQSGGPLLAAGVSLGGNALLRWAQEAGDTAASVARAVCSVSAPLDLAAAGHAIRRGFNRQVYDRMFLASMKPKALAKLDQHPGLFDRVRLLAARDLYEFDDVFTAPLHGFRGVDDYWARGSSKPHLERIRIPALVLNARNDPFVPAGSLPQAAQAGPCVTLWQPREGGHVGFPRGRFPSEVLGLPEAVMGWLMQHAGSCWRVPPGPGCDLPTSRGGQENSGRPGVFS